MSTSQYQYPQINARIKDSNNREYIIQEHIGEGAMSNVFRARAVDNSQLEFAIKIMKYPNDEFSDFKEDMQKEAEYLNRIYPYKASTAVYEKEIKEEYKNAIRASTAKYSVVIMPLLVGKTLQADNYEIPPELKSRTFQQRADLSKQLFKQVNMIHAPSPPAKSAIVVDIHGGNIKVDFDKNQLCMFDLGSAMTVNTSGLVDKPKVLEENAIARSPETVRDNKIGLVSDIYGLVAPTMLIWGAKDPGSIKRKTENNQKLSQKDPKQILKDDFDETGLLDFEIPTFIIPLDRLLRDFIGRMQVKDSEERLQTAAEGEKFFSILENIPVYNSEHKYTADDYKKAAELIVIASGCGNPLTLSDFNDTEKCKNLAQSYNEDPDDCLTKLRDKYANYKDAFRKIINEVYPNHGPTFLGTIKECKEIFLAYSSSKVEDREALKLRLQLANLINILSVSTAISSKKIKELSAIRELSREDYLNVNKTKELLRDVCRVAVRTTFKDESTTGQNMSRFLNSEEFAGLAEYLVPSKGQSVNFDMLYKFATGNQRVGLLDSFTNKFPSDPTIADVNKFKPRW